MVNQKNPVLRLVVPLVMALAGLGVVAAFFVNSKPPAPKQPTQTPAPGPSAPAPSGTASGTTGGPATPAVPESTPSRQPDPAAGATEPSGASGTPTDQTGTPPAPGPVGTLRALPSGQLSADWPGIGAPYKRDADGTQMPGLLDEASPFELRVEFSRYGAGIESLLLAHHHTEWQARQSQGIQATREWTTQALNADGSTTTTQLAASPMAAARVWITEGGVTRDVMLWQSPTRENIWSLVDSGEGFAVFEATIVEASPSNVSPTDAGAEGTSPATAPGETPLLRIRRRFDLSPNSYIVAINQSVENLTSRPLDVQTQQFGPIDLVSDTLGSQTGGYGGDKRRVRLGYLSNPKRDPTQQFVVADNELRPRASVIAAIEAARGRREVPKDIWPTPAALTEGRTLVWAGMTNRYFGVAVHTLVDPASPTPAKGLISITRVEPLVEQLSAVRGDTLLATRLTSAPTRIEPGAAASTTLGLFAGPLSKPAINADPRATAVGLPGLVVYNFGGMCGACTFAWLTGPLIELLRFLHTYITHDWALAIILLVFCVRGALHPVQVWSQIRTQRFAKQMQSMSPKQKKLQEKFKDDKAKLQQETAKLWREEGITPASFVGCIPPFLQTPIWIALSAMIYFAVELRHEAAFFGVFQMISPNWSFLADLSEPDRVIDFGTVFVIPVVGIHFSSLNILPVVLGLVFYVHQKTFTPPTAATMTPEQQQAQVISKWLMVFMFPVMMYAAPSGFTLYFIANSTIAIFQTNWIKKHITKNDLDNPEKAKILAASRRKAVGSSDTFLARMARRVEDAQKARGGTTPGPGKMIQRKPDGGGKEPPKRFKDR